MSPPTPTVAVVGGGIAGLAAAHRIITTRPDSHVVVLEGSPEVGGKLRLGEVAGVQVDLGAESLLNRRSEGTGLAAEVGLADDLVHPTDVRPGLWTRGRVVPLPRSLMGVPADLSAAVHDGALTRRAAIRAELDRVLPAPPLEDDVSVGRLISKRLGPEVRDRLVEPMLGGVYAGHADELSLLATVPQLAAGYAEHGGLLAAARAVTREPDPRAAAPAVPVFAGIVGGVGRLAVATADAVSRLGGDVRTSAMVREMHREPSGWRLVIGPSRAPAELRVDAVVIAVPAVSAARLLSAAVPSAAAELGCVEYASMAVVTLAVARDRVLAAVHGSGFLVPPVEGRVVKAATFSTLKWDWLPGETFLLRCSIGRHRDEAVLQRDDAELVDVAMADLREAVGLQAPLLAATVTRWGGGLPQYTVGHLDRVRRIRAAVAGVPGLAVCGAAYDGVGIPAVIASAEAAATRVVAELGARGTMAS